MAGNELDNLDTRLAAINAALQQFAEQMAPALANMASGIAAWQSAFAAHYEREIAPLWPDLLFIVRHICHEYRLYRARFSPALRRPALARKSQTQIAQRYDRRRYLPAGRCA